MERVEGRERFIEVEEMGRAESEEKKNWHMEK